MLEEKILNDYKQALKNKDRVRSTILNFLRAELINLAIKLGKKSVDDNEAIGVIRKLTKQHRDSIEQFKQGGREDLVVKESQELEILKAYLPAELSSDEIKQIIEEIITQTQAKGPKDMGRVMKEVMAKIANRAEGKLVSDLVKQKLIGSQGEKEGPSQCQG